jgi:DNA-binding transcriptional LysR family regulator
MNIRQLEAFRAFMLTRTVREAATLIGVSQPAVSRLLDQLERALKFDLFDRSKGRLIPTPEAHLMYEEVERTFISVNKIREMATDVRSAKYGHLEIAALPALALGFLPSVLRRFREAHSATKVVLNIQVSRKVEEMVAAQRVDFGIAEYPFERNGIEVAEFFKVPLVLVLPEGHELSSESVITPSHITGAPFIAYTRNCTARTIFDQIMLTVSAQPKIVLECAFSAGICELVRQKQGIGLVDPFTAMDFAGRGVVCRPFRPGVEFRVGVAFPAHRPLPRVARRFLNVLRTMKDDLLWRGDAGGMQMASALEQGPNGQASEPSLCGCPSQG